MSYDLCLLKVPPEAKFDDALRQMDEVLTNEGVGTKECDPQRMARLLMNLEPRYEPFEKDYDEIANFEDLTVEEARKRYNSIEVNGEADGKPMAQFIIYENHVDVHRYSGTTEAELNKYLQALCAETGYAVLDPQKGTITRFPKLP